MPTYLDAHGQPLREKIAWHAASVLLALVVIFGTFGTINAGERGVKTRLGAVVGTAEPGLYFKIPLIESVTKMEVKTRTVNYDKNGNEGDATDTSQLSGASKDLQDVWIGVVVNYHVSADKVTDIYSQYKSVENYEANVIEPIIREVVKSTAAQYTAEELVTKRAEFGDKVNIVLAERFTTKYAVLERFSVTNFEFSQAFTQAIETKVTAVQNAEAAKNKLEQIKFEAQQTVETAKAVAEAQRIQAQSLSALGGRDYVNLKAIEKWDGHLPTQMIPGASVPFLNLTR
ncbi:prohibitin family protein [Candidatus Kaiserbacteria bacterium]|nr:prohibitin family protein [Candidatus Kaiserbacteria bacterium]